MATWCSKHGLLGLIMMSLAAVAAAQYAWTDERGVKQFSDRPPPASVPASRILKAPPGDAPAQNPAAGAPAAGSAAEAVKPAPSLADRNAEFNKRRAEQAEKDKKAAADAETARDRKINCERAQAYSRALESGERLSRTDLNGERNYLSDEQRAQESQDVRKTLAQCK